jgi:hypothetical protein
MLYLTLINENVRNVEEKCQTFREGVNKSRPRDLIRPHNTHQPDITQPISIATKHRELERKIVEE